VRLGDDAAGLPRLFRFSIVQFRFEGAIAVAMRFFQFVSTSFNSDSGTQAGARG